MTVKQPNGVGYVGEEDTYAIDIGRKFRIVYLVNRPLRVLTLYCVTSNGRARVKVKIPNNGGWRNKPEKL